MSSKKPNNTALNMSSEQALNIVNIAKKIRDDKSLLEQAKQNPRSVLSQFGMNLPEKMAVELYIDDDKTLHLMMPADPNTEIADEALGQLNAAKGCAGTASTIGTAGSAFCLCTTASSFGTGGCGGTAGSSS